MTKLYRALGLMSGTSMDGIDVALVETDGNTVVKSQASASVAYTASQRELLERTMREAARMTDRSDRSGILGEAEEMITQSHADAVGLFLKNTGQTSRNIDLVGFHGQTVLHRPQDRLTVQIGDGRKLAAMTGIDVVADMRHADVVAGGQGAPLAPAYHAALAEQLEGTRSSEGTVFVNIGGISNITWVGANGELAAFDTGPGNGLIDQWVKQQTGRLFDEAGKLASKGRPDFQLIEDYLHQPFFSRDFPKSLDRGDFSLDKVSDLTTEDGASTLAWLTARSIVKAADLLPVMPGIWVVCGGGRKNPVVMDALGELLRDAGAVCLSAEQAGFDGDMIEAQAWGFLAVRSVKGLPLTFPGTTGVATPLTGGELFRADDA